MRERTRKSGRARAGTRTGKTVRLRPANPFDLIRLLARSQSDPRKALAELVQNSLDAGAKNITITRRRRRGEAAISVLDDGRGVFPEIERAEALERIATNIGRSFKLNLSPEERHREMQLGKYGIGILGFWAVGRELEMRSRVSGSEVWALRLIRDKPEAEVLRVPERRFEFPGETWTEVVIRGVLEGSGRQVAGRRLGDYLSSELRGQLLERKVRLRIVDRLARGTAAKDFFVVPQRFRGTRLCEIAEVKVPGHTPARLELYFLGEEEEGRRPAVALTCGGTVVCDDISKIEGFGLEGPPWSSGALEGVVEFPDLEVAPATRRGFVPGPAAEAFFAALHTVDADLLQIISREEEKRRFEEDETMAREIRKVFLPLARSLPHYDFFEIRTESKGGGGEPEKEGERLGRHGEEPAGTSGAGPEPGPGSEPEPTSEVLESGDEPEPQEEILPPGPLAGVRIVPRKCRMLPGASRSFLAKAVDEAGRRITEGIVFEWSMASGGGALSREGDQAKFTAPEQPGAATILVKARTLEASAEAEATVEVVERLAGERPDAGIPDPKKVFDGAGDWRSRVVGKRWEYNAAHPDYQAVVDDPKRRLRYLVHLFAKEIVLRNHGGLEDERLLERMVEVLTHIRPRT